MNSRSDANQSGQLPPLRYVIARHDLGTKKSLGQHFLLDGNLTDRIVRAAGDLNGVSVIEVGSGPGGLTRSLLAGNSAQVIAIERDRRCLNALAELKDTYSDRLTIIASDAMETDVLSLSPSPRKIIANLPYNISTALLLKWLPLASEISGMTLMFQKEVAERLIAGPSTKAYGRLSIMTQWLWDAQLSFNVDKKAFTPPPKVTSSVVTFSPRPEPLAAADWRNLETVTAAAFGQRRKMLRSSLKSLAIDIPATGIDPTVRAEDLTVADFCRLAVAYASQQE